MNHQIMRPPFTPVRLDRLLGFGITGEAVATMHRGGVPCAIIGGSSPISAPLQASGHAVASKSYTAGGFEACQTSSTQLILGDLSIDWNIKVPESRRLVGLFSEVWSVQMSEMKVGTFNE